MQRMSAFKTSSVTISPRGEDRVRSGHPWIYGTDVIDATAAPGDVVEVRNARKKVVGRALFSDRSKITLRMIARGEVDVDEAFWRERIASAVRFRQQLDIDATAYRLVHGEADLLPSLVVDRYASVLVVQALSQGMDRLLPTLVPMLVETCHATGVLARNDPRVRQFEGLPQVIDVLYGEVPDHIEVREGPIAYDADVRHGQKTGLFLDQRENREAAARYARGRLLDCFSYHGGFGLRLASHCDSVEAVDVSAEAVARIRVNATKNAVPHLQAREANVFDELRRLEKEEARYDTIVLDPPAFAKNKASVEKARAGYKEINLRALKLLTPGGYLVTCSCSYHVDEAMFGAIVYEAAVDSHADVTVVEKRMQGRDHPVLLGVPETYYLKCLIVRKLL